jgi:hypothetical protein
MKTSIKTTLELLIFFVSWIAISVLVPIPEGISDIWWRFLAELIPFLAIVFLTYIFSKFEKNRLSILHFENPIKQTLAGILLGLIWFFIPFLLLNSLGYLEITDKNYINMLSIWIVSAFINTVMQEFLARGYIYRLLKKEYNIMIATIISTLLFTLMHGGAFEAGPTAVINVITMSLLMTIILEYTNSLLMPIIMHFIWNVMGGIIFGTVSLAEDYPHLYNIKIIGNKLVSGGSFKMEGSIFVCIVNIIMIMIIYYLYKRKNKQTDINKIAPIS